MAAFALQPHAAEFLDIVMHDETLDYRIEEVKIPPASPQVGQCAKLRYTVDGALPSSSAMPRTPTPACSRSAIVVRSASDR